MNLPILLTLSRLPALFLISGFVYIANTGNGTGIWAVPALIVFIAAAFTDWLDGRLARRWNQTSVLGNFLDTLTDKIFVTGLLVLLLFTGILPPWGLFGVLIILSREFLMMGLRLLATHHNTVLQPEKDGKIKATLQMVAIGLFLLALALKQNTPLPNSLYEVVYYCGYGVFILALILTILSGVRYLFKYRSLFSEDKEASENT